MSNTKKFAEMLFQDSYKDSDNFIDYKWIIEFTDNLITLLFPIRNNTKNKSLDDLQVELDKLKSSLKNYLIEFKKKNNLDFEDNVSEILFDKLFFIYEDLKKDLEFTFNQDPASEDLKSIILCYPGFYTLCFYRIAHIISTCSVPILPRILTEHAHEKTGADIHPKAKLGSPIFIDHATGIVIGETAIVGNYVKIYQGVTLGALSVQKSQKESKRHPTIEDNCTLYSNCTILGGSTVVGENSIIGGNVWLIESVEKNSKVFNSNNK